MYFTIAFVNLSILICTICVDAVAYVQAPQSLPEVTLKPKIRLDSVNTSSFYTLKYSELGRIKRLWENRTVIPLELSKAAPKIKKIEHGYLMAKKGDLIAVNAKLELEYKQVGIYKVVQKLFREQEKYPFAVEIIKTGEAEVLYDSFSKLKITKTTGAIEEGNLILPIEHNDAAELSVVDYKQPDHGKIIKIVDGLTVSGDNGSVLINMGTKQNLKNGHLLKIYRQSIKGEPYDIIGNMIIYKTFSDVAYAIITNQTKIIELGDLVAS